MWALVWGPRVQPSGLATASPGPPRPAGLTGTPPHSLPSKFTLRFLQEAPGPCLSEPHAAQADPPSPPSEQRPFLARMVTNQRVTGPSHFQDVRLIEFDVADSGIR